MIGNCNLFSSLSVDSQCCLITIAHGSMSQVTSVGTVETSSVTLDRVLHVSNLFFNLLSMSQITKSLNCLVIFFPCHCVFRDLHTRTMIGGGAESKGVYLLRPTFVAATSIVVSSF